MLFDRRLNSRDNYQAGRKKREARQMTVQDKRRDLQISVAESRRVRDKEKRESNYRDQREYLADKHRSRVRYHRYNHNIIDTR